MSRILPLVMALAVASPAFAARPPHASFRPGEVLVILGNDTVLETTGAGAWSFRSAAATSAIARIGIDRIRPIGPARTGASSPRLVRLSSTRPGFDPPAAAEALRATGAFRAAMPNYLATTFITIPNDPYVLPEQWYIQSPIDSDVDLPDAWDFERGDTSVVIGIADTGVDLGHPDLMGQIWRNWAEIPANLLDDDGNGYVDDVRGWDFGDQDNDPNPHAVFDEVTGIDVGFHGTFVAGIASAATNNATGMAGAGWKSRIMPLKVVDQAGQITAESLGEAFLYAADEGADVLNLSLGFYAEPGLPEFFQALVDYADAAGTVVVGAAGNDADSAPVYPGANDKAISVAATDASKYRASFSNWGPTVDIAAPGEEMWSAICRNYEIDEFSQIYYLFFGWDEVNPYMYGSGTSFSTPLVAGTSALVKAHWPQAGGSAWMEQHLTLTGDAISFDLAIGKFLNARQAVTIAVDVPDSPGSTVSFSASPNPFRERLSLGFTLEQPGAFSLRIVDVQGRTVRTLADRHPGSGPQHIEWDGRRSDGSFAANGIYFATLDGVTGRSVRRIAFVR